MEEASTEVNWIPTVQTFVAVIPATPPKTVPVVPISRLLTTCQLVPFQCSVSVSKAEAPVEDPTAQMSVAETTATPLKLFKPFKEVSMLGLETTFQLVPFQCSVSVSVTQPVLQELEYPTAQMSVAETTATPFNWFVEVPTLGLLTTFQLVPFQCSINVWKAPLELVEDPTAQMSVAETTATAFRTLFDVPTLGLETTFQLVPFHCSISVCWTPPEVVENPTAQTSEAETAATPFS